jgi:hypothetical protein
MMRRLKLILSNSFFVLVLYLAIILTILVAVEMEPAAAEVVRPVEATVEQMEQPARLTDAVPERDITQQRFAPSVMGE